MSLTCVVALTTEDGWGGKARRVWTLSPKQVPEDPLIPFALVPSTNGQAGQALWCGLSLPICKLRAWAHSRKMQHRRYGPGLC